MMVLIDNNLREEVLNLISPTKEEKEELRKLVNRFITRLRRSSKRLNINCDFFIGGSFGKDTFLKNSSDIDIFVRFKDLNSEDLSLNLEKILFEAKLKPNKQKGSRDYFSLKYVSKGIKIIFEIIPIKYINNVDDAENTTDLSPFHVIYINEKARENKNLTDEIRIAKQFFKSKGLYGAESYINGFSGHTIDILVAYYGSFENLIKSARNWNEEEIIDINNNYESVESLKKSLGNNKISNLIVIDPIIKTRNASKALSNDKYCEFILISNQISKLKLDDFKKKELNFKEIISEACDYAKKNNLKYLSYKIKFRISNESEDIVGSKLLKLNKKLVKYFESLDFKPFLTDFFIDINSETSLFIFLFEKINLPKIKKIQGPKVFMKEASKNFLKNRDYYFIENSRICVYEPRIIHNLNSASKLDVEDFYKMLNKDISFVKSVRRKIK